MPTPTRERPLRADAARNRLRILAAASTVFAERGLDVTLDDIARHAGLGVGTVYRRFPDREALVEALFDERMRATVDAARSALEQPDAWAALVDLLQQICERLAGDRGLHQLMLSSTYGQDRVAHHREELVPLLSELVRRAQEAGDLRAAFAAQDIPVLFLMMGAVADFSAEVAPDLWRRYFVVLVDGLRARPDQQEAPGIAPLATGQLDSAMCSHRMRRR